MLSIRVIAFEFFECHLGLNKTVDHAVNMHAEPFTDYDYVSLQLFEVGTGFGIAQFVFKSIRLKVLCRLFEITLEGRRYLVVFDRVDQFPKFMRPAAVTCFSARLGEQSRAQRRSILAKNKIAVVDPIEQSDAFRDFEMLSAPCSEKCVETAADHRDKRGFIELRGKVLLATDFSKHASAAEKLAIALVKRAHPTDCLHVMDAAAREAIPAWPIMARAALEDLVSQIRCHGGTGKSILDEGDPAKSIALVAQGGDYSLIVVGKHGQNWVESMLIGSTAAKVCESAGRAVLMVPLPAQA